MEKNLTTFCPRPWMSISSDISGQGKICCHQHVYFKNKEQHWQYAKDFNSYFNSENYKKIRLQMLSGIKPSQCSVCFKQEQYKGEDVISPRKLYNITYQPYIDHFIKNTNSDGSIDPSAFKIMYIDIGLGTSCNLKCRMCFPFVSFPIAKDWKKIGIPFDYDKAEKVFKSKWFISPQSINLIKSVIPTVQDIFFHGGEPTIIKEHFEILKMIVRENRAKDITIKYNSNQTVIPKELIELWKKFKKIDFHCSIEGYGSLNDYIRYPTVWKKLEKNIYLLDEMASSGEVNLHLEIHSTLNAYNILGIGDFLDYLRYAKFKTIHRFPYFILVEYPVWLSPNIFPTQFKEKAEEDILKKIKQHEEFFLNYNKEHSSFNCTKIKILKGLVEMMKKPPSSEDILNDFIRYTNIFDKIRNQSVHKVLPGLATFFKDTGKLSENP